MIECRRRFIRQIAREESEENPSEKSEHLDEKCQSQIFPHRYLHGCDRYQPQLKAVIEEKPKRQCARSETEQALLTRRPLAVKTAQQNRTKNHCANKINGNCHTLKDFTIDRRLRADTHRCHKEREEEAPFQNARKSAANALVGQWQDDCKQNAERHGELNALLQCRYQLLKKCL